MRIFDFHLIYYVISWSNSIKNLLIKHQLKNHQ